MNYFKCKHCNTTFLVKRDFCPSCFSKDIENLEAREGIVSHSIHLMATPEKFPDEYYLIVGKSSGIVFFCNSSVNIEPGEKVIIENGREGPTCNPS